MNTNLVEHVVAVVESYRRWVGRELSEELSGLSGHQLAERIFEAQVCVVSHGTEPEPLFNYANRCALKLFDVSCEQFIGLPSRFSAEPIEQAKREQFMRAVTRKGFVEGYEGVRIGATGRRFRIEDATVWNVNSRMGHPLGQAATFARWTWLDSV